MTGTESQKNLIKSAIEMYENKRNGVVYLSDCGFASVIIVSDFPATENGKSLLGAVPESTIIGNVLAWGASLIIEAIIKQDANNIWRDELGKVQLT